MHWPTGGRPHRIDSTPINPSPSVYPSFGTLFGWLARHDGDSGALPPYVITPAPRFDSTVYIMPGQYGGCIGSSTMPRAKPCLGTSKPVGGTQEPMALT